MAKAALNKSAVAWHWSDYSGSFPQPSGWQIFPPPKGFPSLERGLIYAGQQMIVRALDCILRAFAWFLWVFRDQSYSSTDTVGTEAPEISAQTPDGIANINTIIAWEPSAEEIDMAMRSAENQ